MAEVFEKTMKCIWQMSRQNNKNHKIQPNTDVYNFFQSLLYGNWALKNSCKLFHYNFYTKKSAECAVFLNENHVQLLTCLDLQMTGVRKYFNLKKIQMHSIHSQYEMDQNIDNEKYLVLKQKDQEFILLFVSKQIRDTFKNNLQKLKQYFSKIPNMYDPLILKAFVKADTNQNDQINYEELKTLVKAMKISMNKHVREFIKKIIKKDKVQKIFFSDFEKIWKIFYCREELVNIFQHYNREKFTAFEEYLRPVMDINQFSLFLKNQQKQSDQNIKQITSKVFTHQNAQISFYQFCLFIFGAQNNLIDQKYLNHSIDTSKPLNHYYCYSSHNTYLTGNQLTSNSKVQRYLIDLQNGLRCVEIDLHDGQNEPIVKHGYTLTSPVTFQKVIAIIDRFTKLNTKQGETPNHSPILLSLEVHCNEKNQIKMAEILQKYFSNRIILVDPKVDQFPSLKQCIGKLIIKGPGNYRLFVDNIKRSDTDEFRQEQFQDDQQTTQEQEKGQQPTYNYSQSHLKHHTLFQSQLQKLKSQKKLFQTKLQIFQKIKTQPYNFHQQLLKHQTSLKQLEQNPKFHHKYKVSSRLLDLTSILSKSKLQNKYKSHWESISLNEKKIEAYFKNNRQLIQELSDQKWFRAYPGGMRVDSSNYNPLPSLQMGIQIIAMNSQKQDDVNNHLMKAFFFKGLNKVAGYRQKPLYYAKNTKTEHKQKPFNLTLIEICFVSALRVYQNDEENSCIPQVKIEAYFTGSQRDNIANQDILRKKAYTNTVQQNSFNPKFTEVQPLHIKCKDIEIAFLIIEIQECGRSVIPLESVKNGWRSISLYDQNLKQKQSRVLCKIQVQKS